MTAFDTLNSLPAGHSMSSNGDSAAADPVPATAAALEHLSVQPPPQSVHESATSYLPFEVVVAVLQRIPQQQRLTTCALVNSTWAAAAAAASSSVLLSLADITPASRHERAAGFSQWLQQHSAHLSSLQLQGNYMSRPRLQLPVDCLQRLRHLALTNSKAAFTAAEAAMPAVHMADGRPSSSSSTQQRPMLESAPGHKLSSSSSSNSRGGSCAYLPTSSARVPAAALVMLRLQGCVLEWGPGLPAHVSLGQLRQLNLQQLLPGELSKAQQASLQQLAPASFQKMSQLTQLVLKQLNQYEGVLLAGLEAGLGGMRHLVELQLDMLQLTAPALAELPASITLLELAGAKQLHLSSSALPSLTKLTDLQELLIEGVRKFEPHLLYSMPKIRSLRIQSSSSRFLPDGTLGTQDLLAALRVLTDLQTLGLRNVLQHLLDEQQAQAYSGLTASSLLQQLDLSACRFPPKCGQAVLHGACSLQYLQRLVLYRCEDPPGSVLQIEDLDSLVDSCPALEDLALWLGPGSSNSGGGGSSGGQTGSSSSSSAANAAAPAGPQPQLQLLPLLGLRALTRLVVAGPGVACAELAAVAQLRGLEALAMYRCSTLNDIALLQLTQLTGLTALAIDAHSCVTKWLGVSEYLYLQGPVSVTSQGGFASQSSVTHGSVAVTQPGQAVTLPVDRSKGAARAIMAVRRELPVWQQLRRLVLTGSLLGDD